MARVLILFAHPAFEKSRVHALMVKELKKLPNVHFQDLYEAYPEFDIDVKKEQDLLLQHDVIIWQHPFYWYSAPAMIKQWQDLVLEHNWAYGSEGRMLEGKMILNVISSGGRQEAYGREGRNHFTIPELLAPFRQTALLCRMHYLPPFVVHGTHRLEKNEMETYAVRYRVLVEALLEDRFQLEELGSVQYINDLIPALQNV